MLLVLGQRRRKTCLPIMWFFGLALWLAVAPLAYAQTTDPAIARNVAPGFWWSPALSGTGFAIEVDQDQIFFLSFHYENGGDATWAAATLTQNATTPSRFDGRLASVAGGPQLGEGARPVSTVTDLGAFRIDFSGPTAARLTWPDGRTTSIMRYEIVAGGLSRAKVSGFPEPGIWWDSNVGGVGYSLDVQGTNIYFAGYFYRADGRPRWCLTGGVMDSTGRFTGSIFEYRNGTPLGGSYRPPAFAGTCGSLVLQVADPETINMVVNNLPPVVLKHYQFSSRPRFPGLVSATASDTTKIDLKWLPATATGVPGNQISYQIFNLPAGQTVPVAANRLATVTGATSTTLTGLTPNTTYRLAIRATAAGYNSLDQSPVAVTTLRVANTLLPGVTFSQPSQLGMVGATMAADGTITTSGQITIANGTIIAGAISNGTILRRVTGSSFSAGVTTIRTTSVSLAEMFSSVNVNANMKGISGNTAANAIRDYYESLGVTRTQGGNSPLDQLERDFQSGLISWNGTQFVTDPQARMLPAQLDLARTQAGILPPSWKQALLTAINARLELIGFAITDLDIEPKITPQLSLASATQFAVGSKVEAEIAAKIVIASSLTRNTVGRCSDALILPSPLVPFLYDVLVIPTPIGPLPVPWEMGGQVKVTCQITKLNIPVPGATALGLGAEAYEYKITPKLEYTASGWTFTGSESSSKSFTGPSDPPTNDLEINAAAGVYAGAYLTLGRSANISYNTDIGLEARFPVVGGYEYEFDAALKAFSPALKEQGGSSDTLAAWDRFIWRAKPQIEIEPVFQLFVKNFSPLKFTIPLGDPVTLFSLPTANAVVTPVNSTSARIDATFTNGVNNNFDAQSPKWTVKSGTTGLSVAKDSSTRATATFDATNRELVYLLFNGSEATKLVAYHAVNPALTTFCGLGVSPFVSGNTPVNFTVDDKTTTTYNPENRQNLLYQTAPQTSSSTFLIGAFALGNGVDRFKGFLADSNQSSLELNLAPSPGSSGAFSRCEEGYTRRGGTVVAIARTCQQYSAGQSPGLQAINLIIPASVTQEIRGSAFTAKTYTVDSSWGQSITNSLVGTVRTIPSGSVTITKQTNNGVPSNISVRLSNFSFTEETTTRLSTGNVDQQVRSLTTAISSSPQISYALTRGTCR